MTDIVERLRTDPSLLSVEEAKALLKEAAAEIERLREQFHYAVRVGQTARDDALEEAATAVEAQRIRFADRTMLAAGIRALKEKSQ